MCARITLGNETYKTKTLENAGGSGVFNEKLSFNKQASENTIQVGQKPTLQHVMYVCGDAPGCIRNKMRAVNGRVFLGQGFRLRHPQQ